MKHQKAFSAALIAGLEAYWGGDASENNPFDPVSDEPKSLLWDLGWKRAQSAELLADLRAQRQKLHEIFLHNKA
jgi:hypothetical protein